MTNAIETRTYSAPYTARLKVAIGDQVTRGQELTEGSIDPKELLTCTRCRRRSTVLAS